MQQILNAAGQDTLSSFLYTLDDRGNRTDAAETLTTPSGMLMGASMPTETPAPTPTPDLPVTPPETPTVTPTETPTTAPAATATVSPTPAATPTVTATESPTPAQTPTALPTETPAETPTLAPTVTLPETATPEATPPQTPAAISAESQALLSLLAAEGEHNWHYQYDGLSRVTLACSDWNGTACDGHEFHYAYDGGGNLLRFDKWNTSTSQVETVRYVIHGANQIACIDADASGTCNGSETAWTYDKFGNLLSDGTNTYTYDTANRLSAVGTTTYQYNGDGDRISQTVGSVSTTYVLDTATPLTMVLSETTGTTTIRYWQGLDLIAQSDGIATTYLSYDGLGSVRQLTDTAESVQLAQTFDPYGTLYSDAGTNSTKFAYTGEYQDSNGLLYLRARYYNAGSGRFTQMDPSRQERNAYQYAASNPVMLTDPSGEICLFNTIYLPWPWPEWKCPSSGTEEEIDDYRLSDEAVYWRGIDEEDLASFAVNQGMLNSCGEFSLTEAINLLLLGTPGKGFSPTDPKALDAADIDKLSQTSTTVNPSGDTFRIEGSFATLSTQIENLVGAINTNYGLDFNAMAQSGNKLELLQRLHNDDSLSLVLIGWDQNKPLVYYKDGQRYIHANLANSTNPAGNLVQNQIFAAHWMVLVAYEPDFMDTGFRAWGFVNSWDDGYLASSPTLYWIRDPEFDVVWGYDIPAVGSHNYVAISMQK